MKKDKKDELLSRRDFFKKAAKRVLPILAVGVMPGLLASCDDDNEELERALNGGSSGCTGSSCSNSCSSYCANSSNNSSGGMHWLFLQFIMLSILQRLFQ